MIAEREPREEGVRSPRDPALGDRSASRSSTSCSNRWCSSPSSRRIALRVLARLSIWLYPIAFVALLLFTVAVTFWVSSMNVRYRDLHPPDRACVARLVLADPDRLRGSREVHTQRADR